MGTVTTSKVTCLVGETQQPRLSTIYDPKFWHNSINGCSQLPWVYEFQRKQNLPFV